MQSAFLNCVLSTCHSLPLNPEMWVTQCAMGKNPTGSKSTSSSTQLSVNSSLSPAHMCADIRSQVWSLDGGALSFHCLVGRRRIVSCDKGIDWDGRLSFQQSVDHAANLFCVWFAHHSIRPTRLQVSSFSFQQGSLWSIFYFGFPRMEFGFKWFGVTLISKQTTSLYFHPPWHLCRDFKLLVSTRDYCDWIWFSNKFIFSCLDAPILVF